MDKNKMPGVGLGVMLINNEQKVLLILRNSDSKLADSDMHLEGAWTLPAGKVRYGETIIEAARRKVKQEVNLDVNNLKIISINDDINKYAHFLTIGLVSDSFTGTIDLGDSLEHVDYKFYDLDNLPENLCEPSKVIIRNYKNNEIYKESEKNG
jgi:8-oxo-dGTP diphosphatase